MHPQAGNQVHHAVVNKSIVARRDPGDVVQHLCDLLPGTRTGGRERVPGTVYGLEVRDGGGGGAGRLPYQWRQLGLRRNIETKKGAQQSSRNSTLLLIRGTNVHNARACPCKAPPHAARAQVTNRTTGRQGARDTRHAPTPHRRCTSLHPPATSLNASLPIDSMMRRPKSGEADNRASTSKQSTTTTMSPHRIMCTTDWTMPCRIDDGGGSWSGRG
jgi:hypothetical protein